MRLRFLTTPSPTGPRQLAVPHASVSDGDVHHAQFAQRVATYGRLVFLASWAFFFVMIAIAATLGRVPPGPTLGSYGSWAQLASGLSFGLLWLYARRPEASPVIASRLERSVTILAGLSFAVMGATWRWPRGDLAALLALTAVTMGRSAIVPSTPRRTFAVTLATALPIVPVSHAIGLETAGFPAFATGPFFAFYALVWGVLVALLATYNSRVIYGLEERVRQATQLGQYQLESLLGAGGMGVVYRASHAMLRRPTAVKLLPPDRSTARDLDRFEHEVMMTSRLTHPNTVAVYDYGRTPEGVFYYAMEYLEGLTLEELVQVYGPQPEARVARIMRQICGSLAEAHAIGLIHRDIKPANIMLCERGLLSDMVKVLDFGLVKELETNITQSAMGTLIGTPQYMSPEAISSPRNVDARADLYAVGAVGYFLLTGKHVFTGETVVEVCSHHLVTAPLPPSTVLGRTVHPTLERIIVACLEKNRDARPPNAKTLAAMLDEVSHDGFTYEDAHRWWMTHRAEILARREQSSESLAPTSPSPTVRVDAGKRKVG